MPYLTPNSAPGDTICRTLVIPADVNWIAIVNGALSELIYANRFEQFGTATPDEVAAVFQTMFYDFLASECAVPDPSIVGEIKLLAHASFPDGWLECYGQALSRTTYADLFAAIGTKYGTGDGSTTFNIPMFQRKFLAGFEPVNGGEFDFGHTGGEESHTLSVTEMPAHTHNVLMSTGGQGNGGGVSVRVPSGSTTSSSVGGGGAHENRPPWGVVLPIIYTGVLDA